MADVAIFLGAGTARVAGRFYAIAPGEAGSVRLADGPELRPLSFGERGALVRSALAAPAPAEELSQGVLAVSRSGDTPHPAAAAIALHLAGAGCAEVGFAAAQSLLARQLGWSAEDVTRAPAAEVDALAADWHKSLQAEPSGWTRIVFEGPTAKEGEDPDAVALSLAADLLRRASAGIDPEALPPISGPSPRAGRAGGVAAQRPAGAGFAQPEMYHPGVGSGLAGMPPDDVMAMTRPTQSTDSAAPQQDQIPIQTSPEQEDRTRKGQLHAPARRNVETATSTGPDTLTVNPVGTVSSPRFFPSPTSDIWAKRPVSAALAQRARLSAITSGVGDHAAVRSFCGWFDDAPTEPDRGRADMPDPAPWVWARADQRDALAIDLPEARPLAVLADPTDALAEALHLAADLRGIAP